MEKKLSAEVSICHRHPYKLTDIVAHPYLTVMPYQFSNTLLLRLPLYPLKKYAEGAESSLQDPVFKAAVYLASPDFYSRLASAGFKWEKLIPKEQATVFKYFNRACYRPTPFGLFATVSLVNWGDKNGVEIHDGALMGHLQPSQEFVQATADFFSASSKLEPNPTLYRVMKDYRFVTTEVSKEGKRSYQLQSTDFSMVLKTILQYCQHGRTATELTLRIGELAQTSPADSEDYITFLSHAQVLLPVWRNQLTGKDYLNRLFRQSSQALKTHEGPPHFSFQMLLKSERLNVNEILSFQKRIANSLPRINYPQSNSLLTSYRNIPEATIDHAYQQAISDGLFALSILAGRDHNPAISQFAKKFRSRFEGERIMLLTALDPESGIGYEEVSREEAEPLLETLQLHPKTATGSNVTWSAAHAYLMKSWLKAEQDGKTEIILQQGDLCSLTEADNRSSHGISVLFRTHQDKVFIESAGGNNLLALSGRFTGEESTYNAMKEIADGIEMQNPSVIFAEILHLSDTHIDNVNLRQPLWSYELPLTAAPSLPPEHQVQLSDLSIIVEGDTVYLWSERHERFVVPRLTSAYNHSINRLPLFRFLADLAYQYGRSNFSFSLRNCFPGMAFYPRVVYKNAILCPAAWIVSESQVREMIKLATHADSLKEYITAQKLPEVFVFGDGDQQLVFNLNHANDRKYFAAIVSNRKEIKLTEWLNDGRLVRGTKGSYYADQYNCFVLPEKRLEMPELKHYTIKPSQTIRKFIPGSEWLYLKLYVPKRNTNKLLLFIAPLMRIKYAHGKIRQWFFVRYDDHAPHIRLRLKVAPEDLDEILQAFRKRLEGHIQEHLIREYQLDVYSRELERYAAGGIVLTEELFCAGSKFVIHYLKKATKKACLPVYLAAALTIIRMSETLLAKEEQKIFFRQAYLDMSLEFEGKNIKYQLDQKYRELSAELTAAIQDRHYLDQFQLGNPSKELTAHALLLKDALSPEEPARTEYLRSIFHMHLNRFFTDEARLQEMVVYFLLYKYLAAVEGRKKQLMV